MKRIALVTDSTACLTEPQQVQHEISVVPLTISLNGQSFREGLDIETAEYYRMLIASSEFPKTSQPSPGAFREVFESLLATHDVVLGLFLSEKLSGTLQSARQAAQLVEGDIRLVDSGIASYGIAGPLMDAARIIRQGATVEDVLALWEFELSHMHAYFVVDSLELLRRGGRIGGAAAVLGTLLQIKPVLTIRDGRIDLFEKIRTHRRALERIVGLFEEITAQGGAFRGAVVHSERLEDAVVLRDELERRNPSVPLDVSELGPVIGSHTGPGALALVFYQQPDGMSLS